MTIADTPVLVWAPEGPLLSTERDASDIVGEAISEGARLVAIPVSRLSPEFLDLRSRLAGEVLQKLVNYGLRAAIVGDVSGEVARSDALRDFIRESNRGGHVWFVEDLVGLAEKLTSQA